MGGGGELVSTPFAKKCNFNPCLCNYVIYLNISQWSFPHPCIPNRLCGNCTLKCFYAFPHKLIQGDQLNMTVFFWYLLKSDLSPVYTCTAAYTFYKVPEKHGHVKLFALYICIAATCSVSSVRNVTLFQLAGSHGLRERLAC